MIKKINVRNFKSIKNLDLELGNFCVFIGANGSGKSNIIEVLSFISDSLRLNVKDAIGSRFGWENVLNRGADIDQRISMNLIFDIRKHIKKIKLNDEIEIAPKQFNYAISIGNDDSGPYIYKENLIGEWKESNKKRSDVFSRSRNKIIRRTDIKVFDLSEKNKEELTLPEKTNYKLFLSAPFFSPTAMVLSDIIREWKYYKIDVNLARRPSYNFENDVLEEDGSNLARILENISEPDNKKTRDRIQSLMKTLIPGFNTWKTERQYDATLGFKIYEEGISDGFLPKMISDGTIRLLSILTALLYETERRFIIAIDEPERCLHPQILKTVVEIIREESKKRQILVTTHSPDIVRFLKPEEIYLVDKKDNQTIVKPAKEIKNIEQFLNNFSMEELWLDGYLEGGNPL